MRRSIPMFAILEWETPSTEIPSQQSTILPKISPWNLSTEKLTIFCIMKKIGKFALKKWRCWIKTQMNKITEFEFVQREEEYSGGCYLLLRQKMNKTLNNNYWQPPQHPINPKSPPIRRNFMILQLQHVSQNSSSDWENTRETQIIAWREAKSLCICDCDNVDAINKAIATGIVSGDVVGSRAGWEGVRGFPVLCLWRDLKLMGKAEKVVEYWLTQANY